MKTPLSCWSTSSFGGTADTPATQRSALGAHLDLCAGLGRRLFALQCAADALHRFVAARFVTTLVGVALLIGLASWV